MEIMKKTEQSQGSESSWWGLFDNVKKQTETIMKIYKEDLQEFSSTLQSDTQHVIEKTKKTQRATQFSSGLSELLGSFTNENQPKPVYLDRKEGRISALEADLATYCTEPVDKEDFKLWKEEFSLQEKTDEISRILSEKEKVRESHTKLVPVAVSYAEFWERYFYKLHKIKMDEERRAALLKRATSTSEEEDHFSWDEDDDQPTEANPAEVENYLEQLDSSDVQGVNTKEIEDKAKVEEEEGEKSDEFQEIKDTSMEKKDELEEDWDQWE